MSLVERALWIIETHLDDPELELGRIAALTGVSRFHLARAFTVGTGHPVMHYVRSRRLTEAAKRLAAGGPDILAIALDAGYASHEAFSRAFRREFGHAPEALRNRTSLDALTLLEPIMIEDHRISLAEPRFINAPGRLVAGLGERYTCDTIQAIPHLWRRFVPHLGHLEAQIGTTTYGVCCDVAGDGQIDYLAGVEVTSSEDLPPGFRCVRLEAGPYAVFVHPENVATLRRTYQAIWNQWLPESGRQVRQAPDFERYDERFDPMTGHGGVEIWIPLEA